MTRSRARDMYPWEVLVIPADERWDPLLPVGEGATQPGCPLKTRLFAPPWLGK